MKEGEMDRAYSAHRGSAYRVLVGKSEGKRALERPRQRQENIEMDLRE
jgi:hypothetical protein